MEYRRTLNLAKLLEKKSFFLLGPRSTGKTTLIRQQLSKKALIVDLLNADTQLRLSAQPNLLEAWLDIAPKRAHPWVVIDEIQKLPVLLDEVQRLIESRKVRFLLTGSSARKLKGHVANLLGGRAWMQHIHPLTSHEIPKFNLDSYLLTGGLPQIYTSKYSAEELRAYSQTYLTEEIRAEALVRKIPAFARFLEVAALSSGQMLNFEQIASDCAVPASTIREYYYLLEDTLMGKMLPAWTKSKKRKAIQTAKFYFFDVGVTNSLAGRRHLERASDAYGNAFEHFIGMEIGAWLDYSRSFDELRYWRSVNDQEVDFIIGDHTAVEVKSTTRVTSRHLKGLRALAEEKKMKRYILVSQDPTAAKIQGIECLHWPRFLKELWEGRFK